MFGSVDRRREAEQQLMEIRDPIAVDPLVRVLGNDARRLRILLDHVLGLIPCAEAAAALVTRILVEADPDVRHVTLGELEQREEPYVIPALVRLRSNNPEVINRAGLDPLEPQRRLRRPPADPGVTPTQYRVVITNSGGSAPAPSPASHGVPIAYNHSAIGLLTPPVVGPGVAAFGATQVPAAGAFPIATPSGIRGPVPKIVPITFQNVEVLAALIHLTGQNFGFDAVSWSAGLAPPSRPTPTPSDVSRSPDWCVRQLSQGGSARRNPPSD